MPVNRSHLIVSGFLNTENFATKRTGRSPNVPIRNRYEHGAKLLGEYVSSIRLSDAKREQPLPPITEETGIYLELTSFPDCLLPLKSLDTADFRLQSVHQSNDVEVAVIFIPDSRRLKLQNKISAYLGPNNKFNNPKNRSLVDSIFSIKLANLKSFWTDRSELFPQNPNEHFWWELWLSKIPQQDPFFILRSLSERLEIEIGQSSLRFFNNTVVSIKASVTQLENAVELISCISELRKARETPTVFLTFNPKEQIDWAQQLISRVSFSTNSSLTAVSVLDTGVNFNHPILSLICSDAKSVAWNPTWPKYEVSTTQAWKHHGSLQAGLVMFGNMPEALLSNNPIPINYEIESGRILPPTGNNSYDLYGAITKDTALKLEIENPNCRRVYSLAITASNDGMGGAPSSWSGELDNFISGFEDEKKRLFVISAGNNRSLSTTPSFWDQGALAEIEDPAQAWNAITVGAFTNFDINDDPTFLGWSLAVVKGDLAPGSTTSVNWGWERQAPFKPDVVEEGGNKLVSPTLTEVSDADTVSLLTTSGQTTGALFDTTRDTSAACALVSRLAAVLLSHTRILMMKQLEA